MEAFAWIASHPIAYPALEAAHIVGIALLFGNLVLFELRVWGLGAVLAVVPLARLSLGLSITGFVLAALSGLTMFATQAGELLANRAFVVKMGLLLLLGANAVWFHLRAGRAGPCADRVVAGVVARGHHLRALDRLRLILAVDRG